MKKLLTDWEWLSIRVLALGTTVFFWSFLTEIDGARELFGDVLEKHSWGYKWEWGFRHYCYTITFAILTTIQSFRIIKWVKGKDEAGGFKVKI
jgi:hypothetical protein